MKGAFAAFHSPARNSIVKVFNGLVAKVPALVVSRVHVVVEIHPPVAFGPVVTKVKIQHTIRELPVEKESSVFIPPEIICFPF